MVLRNVFLFLLVMVYGFTCPDCDDWRGSFAEIEMTRSGYYEDFSVTDSLKITSSFDNPLVYDDGYVHENLELESLSIRVNLLSYDEDMDTFLPIDDKDLFLYKDGVEVNHSIHQYYDCNERCEFDYNLVIPTPGLYLLILDMYGREGVNECHSLDYKTKFSSAINNYELFSEDATRRLKLKLHSRSSSTMNYKNNEKLYFIRVK